MYNLRNFYLEKKYEQNVLIKASRFKHNNKYWSKSSSSSIRLVGTQLLWMSAKCLCFGSLLCVDYTGTRPSWRTQLGRGFCECLSRTDPLPGLRDSSQPGAQLLCQCFWAHQRERHGAQETSGEVCVEVRYEIEFCFMIPGSVIWIMSSQHKCRMLPYWVISKYNGQK